MTAPKQRQLIIIGAGLAGLAAARVAQQRGLDWVMVEASERIGGRVATDVVDGFAIDRGFQVLLTSYPELAPHLDALELGRFAPGAWVRLERQGRSEVAARFHHALDPWRHPLAALRLDWRHVFPVGDALRLARLRASLRHDDAASHGQSTADYLAARGFSPGTMRRFLVPFFGGVLLDRELSAPADFMRRLFGFFARGDAAIPARGMAALPEVLARPLDPTRIRLGCPVIALAGRTATLGDGTMITADAVIIATDADTAAALTSVPELEPPRWHATTTCYFTTDDPLPHPLDQRLLVLDGDGAGPIHHLAPLSTVAPGLAPDQRALICASHDGVADAGLAPAMSAELARWFPATRFHLVAVTPVARGLPAWGTMAPQGTFREVAPRVCVAGDGVADRSIEGALVSGRSAAEHLFGT